MSILALRDHECPRSGVLRLYRPAYETGSRLRRKPHLSRDFIGFLEKLEDAYPTDTAIKIILDNQSAHASKETNNWLANSAMDASASSTPQSTVPGSILSKASSRRRPVRSCAASAWRQKQNSSSESWPILSDINREPVVHTSSCRITLLPTPNSEEAENLSVHTICLPPAQENC
jgi:hypothetical protein